MTIRYKKTDYYCARRSREISVVTYSQNNVHLRRPIRGHGVILISCLDTEFGNSLTKLNWIRKEPVTESC